MSVFGGWFEETHPTSSVEHVWTPTPGGNDVLFTTPGVPWADATSMFCSDFEAFGTTIHATVTVETDYDDDFIGFAFGFNPGELTTQDDADYLLLDWKQLDQTIDGGACLGDVTGLGGLALSRVSGVPSRFHFWGHVGSGVCPPLAAGVEELMRASTLGTTGWGDFVTHDFEMTYKEDALVIKVDGTEEIVYTKPPILEGSFCFFGHEQAPVRYSLESVELCPTPSPTTSFTPTGIPTAPPTLPPSPSPSKAPTTHPSSSPSSEPSIVPSAAPSGWPSKSPSDTPSASPSLEPSALPSTPPSDSPSVMPTWLPTSFPTPVPSVFPSLAPTEDCPPVGADTCNVLSPCTSNSSPIPHYWMHTGNPPLFCMQKCVPDFMLGNMKQWVDYECGPCPCLNE